MADIKPFLVVKDEFVASLDNLVAEAIQLVTAIELATNHDTMSADAMDALATRYAAFRTALFPEDVP